MSGSRRASASWWGRKLLPNQSMIGVERISLRSPQLRWLGVMLRSKAP